MREIISLLFIITVYTSCDHKKSESSIAKPLIIETEQTNNSRWEPTEYRNENWNPEKGFYYFSEEWRWRYRNELIPAGEFGHEGEMSIYMDPPTGTMLLTRDGSSYADDMTDWVIIHPDGTYWQGIRDEAGEPHIIKTDITQSEDYKNRLSYQSDDYNKYVKIKGDTLRFGQNNYDWPTMLGVAYQMTYEMTSDVNELYLATAPINTTFLYLFDRVYEDNQLPVKMPYGYILPSNQLVLSDRYQYQDKVVQHQIVSMSPTDYFLDTNSYLSNQ